METVKIKFKATGGMRSYHDRPDWKDGEEREIELGVAKRLTEDFPDNFSYTRKPPEEKVFEKPAANKMMPKPRRNK